MVKKLNLIFNVVLIITLQSYSFQGILYAVDFDVESNISTFTEVDDILENNNVNIDILEVEGEDSSQHDINFDNADFFSGNQIPVTGSTTGDTNLSGLESLGLSMDSPLPDDQINIFYPTESIFIDEDGRVDINSLESIYINGGLENDTYCSLIARLNIENILLAGIWTDIDTIDAIGRGDAFELINKGLIDGSINKININTIFEELNINKNTIIDIYIQDIIGGELISHRAVLVLGTDGQWYILDPLRGSKNLQPQLLIEYLSKYLGKEEFNIFLGRSYNPVVLEKTIVVPNDIITYQGEVSLEVQAGEIKIEDKGGDSLFETAQDLVIEKISEDSFVIGDIKSHLEFSKPAKIEISVPHLSEGFPIDIIVQHEGDIGFTNKGITLDQNAVCEGGISSSENNFTTVQNGKVTFYTCGASIFNISPSLGTATITTITSGSILNTELPIIGGTGSVEGSDVVLTLSGGLALGTGIVSNGQWFIQPTSNLGLGNHTLCVGANCIDINIIPFVPKGGDTDPDFTGSFASAVVNSIAYQPDGNIVLGGAFTTFNGVTASRVVRITPTGAIDPNFTGISSNTIQTVYRLPDGKIMIGGGFVTYNGTTRNRLVRVTTTGIIDTTFAGTFATNGFVYPIIHQPDGKVLVGGSFTTFNGGSVGRLVRVNTGGSTDSTFTGTFATNGTIFSLLQQSDGKILVGGSFTTFNGVSANGLVRLTETGATDTSFAGSFALTGAINTLAQQPDGKILVGGAFTGFNGATANGLVRLENDGSIDTNFSGLFASGAVNSILQQPDGKILVGGSFIAFNGVAANRLVRITSTGTIDPMYIGAFASGSIATLGLQLDGKVLVGGSFTIFNGGSGNRLVRLGASNYSLIYTGSTGGIISGNSNQTVNFNETGTLVTAVADTGYTFSGWSDGFTGASRIDNVISNSGFIAYFTVNQYTLTYTGSTGGTISGNTIQTLDYYTTGTMVTAIPDSEYTFSGWSDGFTGESRADLVLGDATISALFTINKYTLTYTTGSMGGSISGLLIQNIDYNSTGNEVNVLVDTGYIFSGWSDGLTGLTRKDFVTGDVTFTADFVLATYTLAYTGSIGGTISGAIIQTLNYNNTGTIVEAIVNPGYTFSGWDDGYTGISRSDIVTGDKLYTAFFMSNIVIVTGQDIKGNAGGGGQVGVTIPMPNTNTPSVIVSPVTPDSITSIQNAVQNSTSQILVGSKNEVKITVNPALQKYDQCYNPQDVVNIILGANTKNKDQVVYQGLLRAYGLTKYSETDIYMPEKGLTRQEAAKMLVNFARNVLCRTSQYIYNNQYSDIDQADPTLKEYIILAYEYGIMKGGNGLFRPSDYISEEEFIASLMRTLLGKYLDENGSTWYQSYATVFKDNGYSSLLQFDVGGNNINRYAVSKLIYTLYYNPSYNLTDIGYVLDR